MCEHGIACTLRWGVVLVGGILYWAWLTLHGTTLSGTGSTPVDGDEAVIEKKADM